MDSSMLAQPAGHAHSGTSEYPSFSLMPRSVAVAATLDVRSDALLQLADALANSIAGRCSLNHAAAGMGGGAGDPPAAGTSTTVASAFSRPEDALLASAAASEHGRGLAAAIKELVQSDSDKALRRIQERRLVHSELRRGRIEALEAFRQHISDRVDTTLAAVSLRNAMFRRNLKRQQSTSARRVQELLFECFGELAKARLRSSLHCDQLLDAEGAGASTKREWLQWRRFILRLEHQAADGTQCVAIDADHNTKLYDTAVQCVTEAVTGRQSLQQLRQIQVHRIAVVRNLNKEPSTKPGRANVVKSVTVASDIMEFHDLCNEVLEDTGVAAGSAGSDEWHPTFAPHHLLSSNFLAWLGPAMAANRHMVQVDPKIHRDSSVLQLLAPTPSDARVYYCLEERAVHAQATGSALDAVSAALSSLHGVDISDARIHRLFGRTTDTSAMAAMSAFKVVSRNADHRSLANRSVIRGAAMELLSWLPDVITARWMATKQQDAEPSLFLHFVPATVGNLLETAAFATLVSSDVVAPKHLHVLQDTYAPYTVNSGALSNLYIPLCADHAAKDGMLASNMIALSGSAMLELLTAYAVRGQTEGAAGMNNPDDSGVPGTDDARYVYASLDMAGLRASVDPVSRPATANSEMAGASGRPRLVLPEAMPLAAGVAPGTAVLQPFLTTSSSMTHSYLWIKGGGQPVLDYLSSLEMAAKDSAAATTSDSAGASAARASRKPSPMARLLRPTGLAVGMLVQCIIEPDAVEGLRLSQGGPGAWTSLPMPGASVAAGGAAATPERGTTPRAAAPPAAAANVDEEDVSSHRPVILSVDVDSDREAGSGDEASQPSQDSPRRESTVVAPIDPRLKPMVVAIPPQGIYKTCPTSASRIGPYCRWRACFAPSMRAAEIEFGTHTPAAGAGWEDAQYHRTFCEPHAQLKEMLERRNSKRGAGKSGNSLGEVSRYLPRDWGKRAKYASKLPVTAVVDSSWLLHELDSGKLSSTLESFFSRISTTASEDGSAEGGKQKTSPEAVLQATNNMVSWEMSVAQRVRKVEQRVTQELLRLAALGVYPADALQSIRGEFENLDTERQQILANLETMKEAGATAEQIRQAQIEARQAEAQLELAFCDKKLEILKLKRRQLEQSNGTPGEPDSPDGLGNGGAPAGSRRASTEGHAAVQPPAPPVTRPGTSLGATPSDSRRRKP